MFNNKAFYWIAYILVLVGGINLGFVGLFNVDIIHGLLGGGFSRLIFFIIGLGAVYLLIDFIKSGRMNEAKKEVSEYATKEIDSYKKKKQDKSTNDKPQNGDNNDHGSSAQNDKPSATDNDDSSATKDSSSHPGHAAADDKENKE